jgi:signal transduction histidine kinase
MIMVKCLTPMMRYEKLKLENHFYEMLTATVSHDMRTPINAMTGLLSNIGRFIQDERGLKLLKIVENSSKMLLFLVNDLLDFTQIKNGKFRKNEAPTDIRGVI